MDGFRFREKLKNRKKTAGMNQRRDEKGAVSRKGTGIRKRTVIIASVCVAALLCGCGSASKYARDEAASPSYAITESKSSRSMQNNALADGFYEYDSTETADWGTESFYVADAEYSAESKMTQQTQTQKADSARKIIRRVSMDVETQEFDSLIAGLNAKITELGGYVEQSNIYNGSTFYGNRNTRTASLTVRIPQSRLNEFVNEVSAIGNVTRKSEGSEDVTLTYVDTESRQKALKTEQDRLLELLSKAESLDDILTIENRLSEVRYQIESYTATLRTYDNLVDYSTVSLTVEEVRELTPVVEKEETIWERMGGGFMDSVEGIVDGIKEFAVWFVSHIPQMIIWAVVIVVIVMIWKKRKKGGKFHFGKAKEQNPGVGSEEK